MPTPKHRGMFIPELLWDRDGPCLPQTLIVLHPGHVFFPLFGRNGKGGGVHCILLPTAPLAHVFTKMAFFSAKSSHHKVGQYFELTDENCLSKQQAPMPPTTEWPHGVKST